MTERGYVIEVEFDDGDEAQRAYDAIEGLLGEMGQIGTLGMRPLPSALASTGEQPDCGDGWRPGATAPKEHGVEIRIKIAHARGVPAYWDAELQTFVLSRPVNVESVREPLGWQPLAPSALASTGEQPAPKPSALSAREWSAKHNPLTPPLTPPAPAAAAETKTITAAGIVGDWQRKWSINQEQFNAALDDLELEIRRALSAHAVPSPTVVDYTERARDVYAALVLGDRDGNLGKIAAALYAVASERDAAAIRAFGQRVWSDTEEVAYQAGVSDTRARLLGAGRAGGGRGGVL